MAVPKTLMDALHAALLTDVNEVQRAVEGLHAEVRNLKTSLPEIVSEISTEADQLKRTVKNTASEVEAMGKGLVGAVGRQLDVERQQSLKVHAETATLTKVTLDGFTKYFWLLMGLVGGNFVLMAILLAVALTH